MNGRIEFGLDKLPKNVRSRPEDKGEAKGHSNGVLFGVCQGRAASIERNLRPLHHCRYLPLALSGLVELLHLQNNFARKRIK